MEPVNLVTPWQDNLRIVLVSSRNALNIGAAARAMANFGFADLWCVRPYEVSFRSARSAVGAASILDRARVTKDIVEAVADAELVVGCTRLDARRQRHVQRVLPAGADAIRTHLDTRKAALLFGSEKSGLSNADLNHCDWILSIPTGDDCPSMNLGQAVAVCCYELSRRASPRPDLRTPDGVSVEVRERVLEMLLPVLGESGYLRREGVEDQTRKLRRFVRRLRLAPEDARVLQGMLRQIAWRLDHPGTGGTGPPSDEDSGQSPPQS